MWGYFKANNGAVYEGRYVANAELENGIFVELNGSGKVIPLAAANTNLKLQVVEKRKEHGMYMVGAVVIAEADTGLWFNHTICTLDADLPGDRTQWKIPAGGYVRMRQPLKGDEIYKDVTQALYESLNVGDIVNAGANGVFVKAAG